MKLKQQNINGILAIIEDAAAPKTGGTSLVRRNLSFSDGTRVPAICVDWDTARCFCFEFAAVRSRDLAFFSLISMRTTKIPSGYFTPQFLASRLRQLGFGDECKLVLTPHTAHESAVLDHIGFRGTHPDMRFCLEVSSAEAITRRNPIESCPALAAGPRAVA